MTVTLQATLADTPTPTPTPKDTKCVRGRRGRGWLGCAVPESTAPHHDMKTFYTCPCELKTAVSFLKLQHNCNLTIGRTHHQCPVSNRESHSKAIETHIQLEQREGNNTRDTAGSFTTTNILHVPIFEQYRERTPLAQSTHQMAYEHQVSGIPTQLEHSTLRCLGQNRLGRIRLALAEARRDRVWSVIS